MKAWSASVAAGLGILLTLFVLVAVAGCGRSSKLPLSTPTTKTETTVDTQRQAWERTRDHNYQYTLTMTSMCGILSLRISVNLVTVTGVEVTRPACGVSNSTPDHLIGPFAPRTIDQVFDEVATDYSNGYGMKVTYDAAHGFPASLAVDPIRNAVDDEYQMTLTDYQALP